MTMREYIKNNREEIDEHILRELNKYMKNSVPSANRLNNKERELWILNDEYLYWRARRSGVKI